MTKSSEKPVAAPVIDAPQQVKTVVSFKANIPTQQYGNMEMFVSQEFYTDAAAADSVRLDRIEDTLTALKATIANIILPLACVEVERAKPALVKEAHPDVWMQKNNPLYRWLRVAQPYLPITAMDDLVASRNSAIE